MAKFIEQFMDPGIETDHEWTPEKCKELHKERLTRACAVFAHALHIPRRLGSDANPRELAADKRVIKQVLSRYRMYLGQWGGDPADYEELMQHDATTHQEGAQLDLASYWRDAGAYLGNQLRHTATQALRNGYKKEGNSFCNRLVNELNIVGDILYDPEDQ